MLRATLRGLLARKLRLLLASFAVLLGISFVSGAFVLTDSLSRVFDNLFATINKGTSVTVQGKAAFDGNGFQSTAREPVPQAVLDRVAQVPGVASAIGNVGELATLILPSGKAYSKNGPPTLGVSISVGEPQETLEVVRGRAPQGLTEMALDVKTATEEHLDLGTTVGVVGNGARKNATVVGLVRLGPTNSVAGATLMAFDPLSAQRLFGTPGAWQTLVIAADPGISDTELQGRVAAVLPDGVEALTVAASTAQDSGELKQGLRFFNIVLQVFAGVSLFVGMFLIFNTFSMLVAQRARELALLRALGASRGQVLRSVLVESAAVGLVSSLGGFGVGIGLATGFRSLLNALGLEIPVGETVVRLRTFVVCLVVGVTVTVLAAMIPARRASRVAPVQAMRESGPAEERSLRRRTTGGSVVLALGATALVLGLAQASLALIGAGAVVSFLGVTLVSPVFARPVVGLLALPFTRVGVAGRLGRGNAMRSPRRTATTAAALMIGLALVSAISTLGASAKKSVVQTVATSFGADYVLHTSQYEPFTPAVAAALAERPELADVAAFRQTRARIGSAGVETLQGVDPAALQATLTLKVLSGDLAGLGDDQIALDVTQAKALRVRLGDRLPVTWTRTGRQTYRVGAVYATNQFAGGYLLTSTAYAANVTDPKTVVVALSGRPSVTPAASRAAIEAVLADYPSVQVEDQREFIATQGRQIDQLLNVLTGLLVLSVLIAVLGIINTLALSVVERTRELGLLRAVGLQRRQLKRMIRVESVVIAVFGALLGIVVGLAFGYAFVSALHDQGITEFAVPTGRLVVVLLAAVVGGLLAASLPARRASRLKVLDAISHA